MTFILNKERYSKEMAARWAKEKEKEHSILESICHTWNKLLNTSLQFERFDQNWFNLFPPEIESWVRGVPDYQIKLSDGNVLWTELKIKDHAFRKTAQGGTTKQGHVIPNYGCESFYLDVEPVWKNMNLFCEKTGLSERHFFLFFATPEDIRYIPLYIINQMMKQHFWIHPKTKEQMTLMSDYQEGYGKTCMLIPHICTASIFNSRLDLNKFQTYVTSNIHPNDVRDHSFHSLDVLPKHSDFKSKK